MGRNGCHAPRCGVAKERFDETRSEYAASFHSRRLSASMDHALINGCDESPKIVEIDRGRPKSRSRRPVTLLSDCADDAPPHSSPLLPCQVPARISITDPRKINFHDFDWCALTGDECRFSTAQSTPRFVNSGGIMPSTPAKSVCGGDVMIRRYHHHHLSKDPSYMAKTQSFEAKVRSQSTPKQRPEPAGPKRQSLHNMVEPRASLSGVRMHRSYSQQPAPETFSFKNAMVGRLDRSMDLSRDIERDHYHLQRRC